MKNVNGDGVVQCRFFLPVFNGLVFNLAHNE